MGNDGRDVATLDPQFATTTPAYPIVWELFDSLVRMPPGVVDIEQIEPSLAVSWESSEDFKQWTFELREDVAWHGDYGPFTADDVVFSFERILDEEVASPWFGTFGNLESVEALDDYTVRFHLHGSDPFFLLHLIDYQGGFIVGRAAVEALGPDFGLNPIGTGRFQFVSHTPNDSVVLEANPEYFRGAPALDGIIYKFMPDISSRNLALRNRELHTAHGVRQQDWIEEMESYGLVVEPVSQGSAVTLHFNMTRPPLDDLKVRQALAYAIDRNELVSFVGESIASPLYSPVPEGYFGWVSEGLPRYDHDPDLARELLSEAGFADGLTLEAYMSESELYLPIMQVIQEQWRRVGVNLELTVVDHPTYHRLIREDANDVIAYDASRQPVANIYLTQFYSAPAAIGQPTAVTNFSHIGEVTEGIDGFLEQAEESLDLAERERLYGLAQHRILEQMAVMPLMTRFGVGVRQPNVNLGYEGTVFTIDHYYYTIDTTIE